MHDLVNLRILVQISIFSLFKSDIIFRAKNSDFGDSVQKRPRVGAIKLERFFWGRVFLPRGIGHF
jgi:hypothetical protein